VTADEERRRRWRLMLGEAGTDQQGDELSAGDRAMDAALAALYDDPGDRDEPGGSGAGPRTGGLGTSAPRVARWLGDIRTYFPASVVSVMQRDALERLDVAALLLEPELLSSLEPDVHLVSTLLTLQRVLPDETRATARAVVRSVVAEVERRLADRTRSAVRGSLDRASRTHRPALRDVDWNRTIAANLAHYLPEHRTVVPHRLVGHGRRQRVVGRDVIVAVDQSASMAESVVYASVFAAVLASLRALRTSLVVFDTAVVDLTDQLDDPVDVLFATQLGGGTDIQRALAYCQTLVRRPDDTLLVLVSDLFEGGPRDDLLRRVADLVRSGVQVVTLLALGDSGAPQFDHEVAAAVAALGVPAFACTPDAFPDLLAVALARGDVAGWAQRELGAAARPPAPVSIAAELADASGAGPGRITASARRSSPRAP
jgi:Mg-chelatase subunit ChlD